MIHGKNHMSLKIKCLFILLTVLTTACSLLVGKDECEKNTDCSGANLICKQGTCIKADQNTALLNNLLSKECTRIYGYPTTNANLFNQNTVLLGSVLPTTGALSARGTKREQAIQLAVDEINAAGGIHGKHLAVLFCDSATSTENTTRALTHIASLNRIPAVIGPSSSSVLIESFGAVAKNNNILLMSPSATSPQISSLQDNNMIWRTVPSDAIQGAAIANYLLLERAFEKIAIINRNDAYGNGLRDEILANLEGKFPYTDDNRFINRVYNPETPETDQSQILVELEKFAPSVTVLIGLFADGSKFLELSAGKDIGQLMLSDGLNGEQLNTLPFTDNQFCRLAGTQAASVEGDIYQSFLLRFNAAYGGVDGYSANTYDATYLLAYAIAATNSATPAGIDVAQGLTRLSTGETILAGTADWQKGIQILASSAAATIDYEGASGPLNFDSNGDVSATIEGWAFNTDTRTTFSLGTAFTHDGKYVDVFENVPGKGAACSAIGQTECKNSDDCGEGAYCDKSRTPFVCTLPPSGQGELCTTNDDCSGFEANYCETMVTGTCLKQGCSEELNDCADDHICCNFSDFMLPSLCVDKVTSRGLCTRGSGCTSDDDCPEGTHCDLAAQPTPFCVLPPSGQGQTCETQADCASFGATYCETGFTHTCLWQGCDKNLNNCSAGYQCCEFSWMNLPNLCVDITVSGGQCACGTTENCKDGDYCDLTLDVPLCFPPPTGQGTACTAAADCAAFEADFCDVNGSATCLKQGCDATANNCSPGYHCCDFSWTEERPALCIDETRYNAECVAPQ
ncbi:MAG: ABC transporter substrate-binding protein [Deltaproteobacteria bacterium]|nr:ABC transporter substrate-binding protein [Deltaproteobacteria bacterium]